jgi:NAD(P)-dependent dehydrogenase (short-subunit alcohol dehydrogenase family)
MAERVAIVTGGGKGIGRAVVGRLAAEGLRVVAAGRDLEALERTAAEAGASTSVEAGGEVVARRCDVTSEEDVAALFGDSGPVEVLVNNAGVSSAAPLARTTLEDWHSQLEVNATGAFLCTRAAVPGMLERDRGRLVTVASTAGRVGYPYAAAYTASKHAAVGMMRAVAAELEGTGVTANAVCPTFVATEMTERSVARISAATGRDEAASRRELERASPLERLLDPDEVADAVAFLASSGAAAINGQTLLIDGGGIQT